MKQFTLILATIILFQILNLAQQQKRWDLTSDGIVWNIKSGETHSDHIEMSGKKVSTVVRYKVAEDGALELSRSVVWPLLRTIPNNTHASLTRRFSIDIPSLLIINGKNPVNEKVQSISHNGLMTIISKFDPGVEIKRILFPSYNQPAFCESYSVKNISSKNLTIEIPELKNVYKTLPEAGVEGSYFPTVKLYNSGTFKVEPEKEISFSVAFIGNRTDEDIFVDVNKELTERIKFIDIIKNQLVFESPDEVLNKVFQFAKIRGSESIYETKGGFMHGPGGESYYAAIWANDQAEYIGPFFPYLGYDIGNKASLNAYKHFARFMNPEYKPIPSSIIAEGLDIWNGAGDRGDAAMIAYGAARFALASGDKNIAKELWKLIEWCLEYCNRKIDKNGVVASDSDELEGRFPSGNANLCTSSLYYDALISSTYLVKELNLPKKDYLKQAELLRKNIEKHFGYTLKGFETYRYYEGNDKLRAWICIPLTVGIFDRKQGTIDALFSPQLWTNDGLATEEGDKTFWDRSTLYALHGVFAAGETEKAIDYLKYYSNRRLLGDHVPYPVEAYPEGNQRHLSAESGLYCRIITEGIFGIRPTGLKTFTLTPRLPKDWNNMKLKHVRLFGEDFDISVTRKNEKLEVQITKGKKLFSKTIKSGSTSEIEL
ncbi:MAG: hypothetical protein A2499_02645 [Stygiobacter sp. RIFOXYC12_FULL_38_8]|nr:MAG: hypothetical protein A2279_11525 [Stygiobacter sp. RIFOXYA12_FULL_38_9]OGV08812.1 MAG: hypothetical protein A2299_18480 [Stygiobacter sp. RIFOXYB2_FULL_37_11]OGV15478.1 MAG: hypothetical protein A2440_00240 [Stygiobacter sp. RIFOXYC2_FULL_38_25]OGV18239.1 MAG: hypothetical protein A2237_15340 [Stygiobacter sp. RIFOXYA2_FULL_38_8]OGV26464.1 MAG: hypothetical protein A2499_02645 [Stygiobacter sp. RIFOXYC12_FULL_38_8]OGV80592.1 MAG: hypothetical protein A2X65_05290 [Stygiobacter sp. GWF2_